VKAVVTAADLPAPESSGNQLLLKPGVEFEE